MEPIFLGVIAGASIAAALNLKSYLPQIRDLLKENRDLLKKATAHLEDLPEEKK